MSETRFIYSSHTVSGVVIGSFLFYCWYSNLGVALSVQLFFKCVLFMGVATLCLHYLTRIYKVCSESLIKGNQQPIERNIIEDENLLKEKRRQAIGKSQENHDEKTNEWYERVLKPREDKKFQEKEDKFYKNSKWKSRGDTLGGSVGYRKGAGTSDDAKQARVLPEREASNAKGTQQTETNVVKEKQVYTVPEEPDEGEGVITLIFRTPSGRKYQRRFYTDTKIQSLQNYITTIGYHKKIYGIYTSYPRQCISENPNISLKDLSITKSSALNIEEMED